MAVSKEKVKKWVIDYQHNLLMERYNDVEEGEPIREFFGKYLYPNYENREEYIARAEFFRKVVKVYMQGKIGKILDGGMALFLPILTFTKKMKELPRYLKLVIELYDLTNELDERVINALHSMINDEQELNKENYEAAVRKVTTYAERQKQLEIMISIGEYARDLVKKGGVIDLLVERCPKMPFFARNKYVKSINETIDMVKTAYRAFKSTKDKLNYFRDYIREKEYEYLNYLFKNSNS